MDEMNAYLNDIDHVLTLIPPFAPLDGCNILITGATGLIGSCIVDILMRPAKRTYHLTATGRNMERAQKRFSNYLDDKGFTLLRYDVNNPLEGDTCYDYIIHAASNASPNFFLNHPVEVMTSNINGVAHLMQYGIAHGMRRMLYVSSGEVYGKSNVKIFKEQDNGYVDCTSVRSCYPSAKRAAETLCVSFAQEYKTEVVIARPCHTYGPHFTEDDNRAYAQFLRDTLQGHDIVLKSKGDQIRSWIYVVDCASALLHILLEGASGEAYNVADKHSVLTIKQFAEAISYAAGRKVVFEIPDTADRGNTTPIKHAIFSTSKLEALGWRPLTPFDEAIAHTLSTLTTKKANKEE